LHEKAIAIHQNCMKKTLSFIVYTEITFKILNKSNVENFQEFLQLKIFSGVARLSILFLYRAVSVDPMNPIFPLKQHA
jgi:hypothetical protein